MCILKPFLPEDVRKQLVEKIKKQVSSSGGKALEEDIWGKRHLAYKIKGHEEGYYILYRFSLSSDKVKELESDLKMTNDLLRYIIIKED